MASPVSSPVRRQTAWETEFALLDAMMRLEDLEDDDTPDELAGLVYDCMQAALEKRDALAAARKSQSSFIAELYERAADATMKAQRAERVLERLDKYILSILDGMDKKVLDGVQYKIGWRQNPSRVEIGPEFGETPTPYLRTRLEYEPDKKAIAEALKRGESVPGATLVEGNRRIVVT